jgi:hypothetical protein
MLCSRRLFLTCALALAWLSPAPPAAAQDGVWRRAESEHFIVFSRGSERSLRDATQQLEQFRDLLRELTRARAPSSPVKLPVYLLDDQRALRVVRPDVPEQVAGFYTYRPEFVGAFAIHDNAGWEGGVQQILFHEYAHHFMMQYFTTTYPAWYVEGFAEYVSTVEFARGRTNVGQPSAMRATTLLGLGMRLLPTEMMLAPPEVRTERQDQTTRRNT